MKRSVLLKYLKKYNCELLREGGNHSWFINHSNNKYSSIPRHIEISDILCNQICKQLQIPPIKK